MALMDTPEAVKHLQNAGFDEEKAEAKVRVVGKGQDALATNADLEAQTLISRSDLQALEQSTKADLQAHGQANEADLEALELRLRHDLTLRLGAMVFAAAGAQVVIVVFLLTQFFAN